MSAFTPPDQISPVTRAKAAHINALNTACTVAFASLPSADELTGGVINYATSTGSANAYIVALPYVPSSYFDGLVVDFKANHSNTGAATANVNGLGVKSLRRQNGIALSAGDLIANKIYSFRYNATSGYLELQQLAAGNMADVTTVGGIASSVSTIAGISADVTTVAGSVGNISTVSGISANVTTVAGISSHVTTVSGNTTNINTVAGISANVTTVAGISSAVSTVSGISANVTTVAGISAAVTTAAGVSAAIVAAPAQAAAAAASALASSGSATASAASALVSLNASRMRNKLINGGFDIWDYGTSFTSATTPANSDGEYLVNRWFLLSDGNDIVDVTRESTVIPSYSNYSLKADVETANKKFMFGQIIENQDCTSIIDRSVSLSFSVRGSTGGTIGAIHAAIISWQGTADTPTLDVVSSWGGSGVHPTLATSWTYEGYNSFSVTDSFQVCKLENVVIDTAGTKNVAVIIWSDDVATTVGDLLYIGNVQLEKGSVSTDFEVLPLEVVRVLCARYYKIIRVGWTWYNAAHPVTNRLLVPFERMRVAPTPTLSVVNSTNLNTHIVSWIGKSFVEMQATSGSINTAIARYIIYLDAELGV